MFIIIVIGMPSRKRQISNLQNDADTIVTNPIKKRKLNLNHNRETAPTQSTNSCVLSPSNINFNSTTNRQSNTYNRQNNTHNRPFIILPTTTYFKTQYKVVSVQHQNQRTGLILAHKTQSRFLCILFQENTKIWQHTIHRTTLNVAWSNALDKLVIAYSIYSIQLFVLNEADGDRIKPCDIGFVDYRTEANGDIKSIQFTHHDTHIMLITKRGLIFQKPIDYLNRCTHNSSMLHHVYAYFGTCWRA